MNKKHTGKDRQKAKGNLKDAFNYALDELFKGNLKDEDGKKVETYEQLFNTVAYLANRYVFKNSKIISASPIFMKFLKIYEIYYLINIFIIKNEALHTFIKKHGGFNDKEVLKNPLGIVAKKSDNNSDAESSNAESSDGRATTQVTNKNKDYSDKGVDKMSLF